VSAADPGCIHSAGALKNGKLSLGTYDKIIQDIIAAGRLGFASVGKFPCAAGINLPAAPGIVPDDLADKEKYPDFHKNVMGNFEKVALGLDVKGNFSLPFPFWDPFALALKLDLDPPTFDLPDLPSLTPPDLALSLGLRIPDAPKLAALLSLPKPPEIDVPILDLNINKPEFGLDAKFKFDLWPIALIDLIVSLAVPGLLIDLPKLLKVPPDPCFVIDKVVKAQIFGPTDPGDLAKVIAIQVLADFTGQCATVAVASMVVGDGGPSGVTGNLGTQYGWKSAEPVTGNELDKRAKNTLITAFKELFNRDPNVKEVQFAQTIAKIENNYGQAWPGTSKKEVPAEAYRSNNWGNIHGSGPAGSFTYIDYDADNKPYSTTYAMFGTPVEGAKRILKELYVARPYILDAVNQSQTLYKPTYLMSSKAVFGKNYKDKSPKAADDALIPPDKGGLTYYEAPPDFYFKNVQIGLKNILKVLKDSTEFDVTTKVLT